MKNSAGQFMCGASIKGPKVARNVVAWITYCKNPVKNDGDRCHHHVRKYRAGGA